MNAVHSEVLMNRLVLLLAVFVMGFAVSGCNSGPVRNGYPHTVDNGGVMHGEGIADPLANCTECHGANLEGTADTPSCTSCHERRW
jgi:hypothetical protein